MRGSSGAAPAAPPADRYVPPSRSSQPPSRTETPQSSSDKPEEPKSSGGKWVPRWRQQQQ
jgi:translation initiation factor 3 subunit A